MCATGSKKQAKVGTSPHWGHGQGVCFYGGPHSGVLPRLQVTPPCVTFRRLLLLYEALDGHPFFPSHVASGRCFLSAAAAGALAAPPPPPPPPCQNNGEVPKSCGNNNSRRLDKGVVYAHPQETRSERKR